MKGEPFLFHSIQQQQQQPTNQEPTPVVWLGRLVEVTDPDRRDRAGQVLAEKYASFRMVRSGVPDATKQHYGATDVMYELRPDERRLSWDNRKLRLADTQ